MGFFDFFKPQTPQITSALPDAAKRQINSGKLPTLTSNRMFFRNGEACYYIDRAIYEKRIVQKRRVRRSTGYSTPGLYGGSRFRTGGSNITTVDDVRYEMCKGVLYITNQRIVFVGAQPGFGFDVDIGAVVAVIPYANCVELQLDTENLKLFVPDGGLLHKVLNLMK